MLNVRIKFHILKLYMCEKFSEFLSSEKLGWICTAIATVGTLFFAIHCYTLASFVWLVSNGLFVVYNVKREKPLWAQAMFFVLNSALCLAQLFC